VASRRFPTARANTTCRSPMHESIRLRIKHFLEGRSTPAIA
jgi:hypothetical protein